MAEGYLIVRTPSRRRRALASAAALFILLLAASSIASAGPLEDLVGATISFLIKNAFMDTLKNVVNQGIIILLDLYKGLMLMNPDPEDIRPLSDSFVKMLVPVYVIAIMLTGFYWLFLSMSPRSRAKAKAMLLKLLISMPLVMSSTAIFQFMLDISSLVTNLMLSMGQVSVSGFSALIVAGLALMILASPFVLIALLAVIVVMILVSVFRYMVLFFMAAIFPLVIFLFLFDFDLTKDLGSHLMRYTLAAAFAPVLQAFFIIFTMTALNGGVDYQQLVGVSTFTAALAQMAIIFAGCIMVILSPLMMLGLMKWVGLFMVGWAFGNMATLSKNFGSLGEAFGMGLVGAGGLIAGEGPGAIPLAGTLWFVQALGAHSPVGHHTQSGAFGRYTRNRGWPPGGGGGSGHGGPGGGTGHGGPGSGGPGGGGGTGHGGPGSGGGGGGPKITVSSDPMEHIGNAEKILSGSGKKPQPKAAVKEAIDYIKTGLALGNKIDPATGQARLDNKNKAKAYALLGDAHSTLGETGKAIDAYKQAASLDKSRHDYALKLADAYYKKG
jgi:hypothetical protein